MGTEVLRPQDLLADRFRAPPASFQRRRNFPGNGNLTNLIVNRKPSYNNTGYKKTSPRPDKKKFNAAGDNGGAKKATHGGAVAEARRRDDGASTAHVTILRRGQSLDSGTSKMKGGSYRLKSPRQKPVDDLAVIGTRRSGPPSPVMVPKQIRMSPLPLSDMYAGSACSQSPSPRSLPLPSFFNKKQQNDSIDDKSYDDSATRDLRRLLRLD
ncbi:hypothetical protein Salat_1772900 [Sesamum alatum]|uniref:Uncharacterized protein n=1 Tax=Sesamum alatum TaxID=300844 RepID=A0AAE1Y9H5_9LAMI|nr:hypothetical protein Salat_1772900 [Sesamum alatum]